MAEWMGRKALRRQSRAATRGWVEAGKCVTSKKRLRKSTNAIVQPTAKTELKYYLDQKSFCLNQEACFPKENVLRHLKLPNKEEFPHGVLNEKSITTRKILNYFSLKNAKLFSVLTLTTSHYEYIIGLTTLYSP